MPLDYDSLFESDEGLAPDTIPVDVDPFEDTTAYEVLAPGDRFHHRYICERELEPGRYLVKHIGLLQRFELSLHEHLDRRSFEVFERATQRASLAADDRLGYVLEVGEDSQQGQFVVSEYIEGKSLTQVLDDPKEWTLEELLDFATAIGEALGSLHEIGLPHGLSSTACIRLSESEQWKLIPEMPRMSVEWRPRAPEIAHPTDVSFRSDQFAFASILYRLLTGSFPEGDTPILPSSLRVDLPDHFDRALMTALERNPAARWDSLSEMLATLRRGVRFWRQPTIVPFDAREASMLLRMHPDSEKMPNHLSKRTNSVIVRAPSRATLEGQRPELHVNFESLARLRREFRRNLIFGCMFVPMVDPPSPGTDVEATLSLSSSEKGACSNLIGTVTNVNEARPGQPPGCGLLLDESETQRLHKWLEAIGIHEQDARHGTIDLGPAELEDAAVSADALFLGSWVTGPTSIDELRSHMMGLPIDVDQSLKELIDAHVLVLRESSTVMADSLVEPSSFDSVAQTRRLMPFDDTDRQVLIERILDFDRNFNGKGAQTLADRALAMYPDDAVLIAQRAVQIARYELDWKRAESLIQRAVALDPKNDEVTSARAFLRTLSGEVRKLLKSVP